MRPLRDSISEKSLVLMGVPKKFTRMTLDDYKVGSSKNLKTIKKFIKEYLDNLEYNLENNIGILFMGSNGVGKSMLSCIILKEAYRHRYSCRRVTFSQYINAYTETWSNSDSDLLNIYRSVEFLVLEEVGKEIESKIALPILEDLLRYREENGLTTIICTNLNGSSLKEIYKESIVSLIKGQTIRVVIESGDLRQEKLKEKIYD